MYIFALRVTLPYETTGISCGIRLTHNSGFSYLIFYALPAEMCFARSFPFHPEAKLTANSGALWNM